METLRKGITVFITALSAFAILAAFDQDGLNTATAAGPEVTGAQISGANLGRAGIVSRRDLKRVASRAIEQETLGDISRENLANDAGRSQTARLSNSRLYPEPRLEKTLLTTDGNGGLKLADLPQFSTKLSGKLAGATTKGDFIFYTLEPELQRYTADLVKSSKAANVAIVVMDPTNGKILAIADKSTSVKNTALHSGFPAASIFKLVTSAAALDQGLIEPLSTIRYRGGTYTLERWNYKPDARKDSRFMTAAEALGRSCNAVFGRIGLQLLSPPELRKYANAFGFNTDLGSDFLMPTSAAYIPADDYELSRTSAGFGEVTLSPIHAASLMSGIANGGLLPRPHIIDEVITADGRALYKARREYLKRLASPQTLRDLLKMMEYTTTIGTSRKEFMKKNQMVLKNVSVAAKTGTLSGTNPKGLNNWFVAAAPSNNAKVAISVIVNNPTHSSVKASHLGRLVLEQYLKTH